MFYVTNGVSVSYWLMAKRSISRVPAHKRKQVLATISRIGAEIQFTRLSVGMTQETLAELVDSSSNMISYIETGRKVPSLAMLVQISMVLKMEIKIKP